MKQTPYSKKYKLDTRLSNLNKDNYELLQAVVNDILDNYPAKGRFFGVPAISKLIREYEEYDKFKLDTKVTNKFVIGYCIDIHPKTTWKNCNCGGTGNWRVNI